MTILNQMNDVLHRNNDFLKRQEEQLAHAALTQVMKSLTVQPNEQYNESSLKKSPALTNWSELYGNKENVSNLFKEAQNAVLKNHNGNKEALINQRDQLEKTLNKAQYKLPLLFSTQKEAIKNEVTNLNQKIEKAQSTIELIKERGKSLSSDVDYYVNQKNELRSLGIPEHDQNSKFAEAYRDYKVEVHSGIKESDSQLSKTQVLTLTQDTAITEPTDKLGHRLSITSNLLTEMEDKLNIINQLKANGIQVSDDLRKEANSTISSLTLSFDKEKNLYEQGNMALSFKNDKGIGIEASDLQRKGLTHQANEAENKLSNMLIKNDAALSDVTKVLASEDQKFNSLFQSNFSNEKNEKQHDKEPALER